MARYAMASTSPGYSPIFWREVLPEGYRWKLEIHHAAYQSTPVDESLAMAVAAINDVSCNIAAWSLADAVKQNTAGIEAAGLCRYDIREPEGEPDKPIDHRAVEVFNSIIMAGVPVPAYEHGLTENTAAVATDLCQYDTRIPEGVPVAQITLSSELRARMAERKRCIEVLEMQRFDGPVGDVYGQGWNDVLEKVLAILREGGRVNA